MTVKAVTIHALRMKDSARVIASVVISHCRNSQVHYTSKYIRSLSHDSP